ncbi:MAG: hypothetical protein AAB495_01330 [Patescibacteria group bacterium]
MKDEFRGRFIFNLSIIFGSILLGIGVLYILELQIEKTSVSIRNNRMRIAERSFALDNLAGLKRGEAAAESYKKKIDSLLPARDGLFGLGRFFEATARTYDMSASFSFQGSPTEPQDGRPGYVQFVLRTAGSEQNIQSLIKFFETQSTQFLINIETIDLVPSSEGYRGDVFGKAFFK